jgi:hypothetical protein
VEILRKLAELMEGKREHLGRQIAREGGKPLTDALIETDRAIDGVRNAVDELRVRGGREIPMGLTSVRRLVTMLPSFAVVGFGADPTNALVISQVVLSLALPLPMLALVLFTRRAGIMGRFANGGLTHAAAIAGTTLVLSLNALLVLQTFGVAVPGLPSAG